MNDLILNKYLNRITMAGAWHPPLDWKTSLIPFSERSYFNMVASYTWFLKTDHPEKTPFDFIFYQPRGFTWQFSNIAKKQEFGSVDFHIGSILNNTFCY